MSQCPVPISLGLSLSNETSPTIQVPERPASVSSASTIGTPASPNLYSALFFPGQLLSPPVFPAVLDPTLLLSARKIKAEFLRRDILFARLIIGILAPRIELGILPPPNGIGFPFTDKDERKVSPPSDSS
jgi:hypothetical protein